MFKGPRKSALIQENTTLRQQLKDIKFSPTYLLAQGIEEDTEAALRSGDGDYQALQEAAIEKRRADILRKSIGALARQKAEAEIEKQKEAIRKEAEQKAAEIAGKIVQQFLATDAETYRVRVQKEATRRRTSLELTRAKSAILREEGALDSQSRAPEAGIQETREQRKQRAKEIRTATKNSQILPLAMFQIGDAITLGFTDVGKGNAALTTYDTWSESGTYNSTLERRKLTCRILDPDTGIVEVERDSWFGDSNKQKSTAIRGGKQFILNTEHPDTNELSPILVKATPVTLEPLEGNETVQPPLDLWWVNLDEFRALS